MKLLTTLLLAATFCSTSPVLAGLSLNERAGDNAVFTAKKHEKRDLRELTLEEWRERMNHEPGAAHARLKAGARSKNLTQAMPQSPKTGIIQTPR